MPRWQWCHWSPCQSPAAEVPPALEQRRPGVLLRAPRSTILDRRGSLARFLGHMQHNGVLLGHGHRRLHRVRCAHHGPASVVLKQSRPGWVHQHQPFGHVCKQRPRLDPGRMPQHPRGSRRPTSGRNRAAPLSGRIDLERHTPRTWEPHPHHPLPHLLRARARGQAWHDALDACRWHRPTPTSPCPRSHREVLPCRPHEGAALRTFPSDPAPGNRCWQHFD
mmetsp:Transcript_107827/g.131563  ORF Transcript_107827/g.131563 Transcript_107827/m.131563 type:complete len:221 (-) Transcript_107827:535-1197(-)